MGEAMQLNFTGWHSEEVIKTEKAIHHLERVMGTFLAEKDPTVNMLRGYLNGLNATYREYENRSEPMPFGGGCGSANIRSKVSQ